jgi:hypothetical protein
MASSLEELSTVDSKAKVTPVETDDSSMKATSSTASFVMPEKQTLAVSSPPVCIERDSHNFSRSIMTKMKK